MLRRAALLLLLAAPLGALAVTESMTFNPPELGTKDCSTARDVNIGWTVNLDTTSDTVVTGDTWTVDVSQTAGCTSGAKVLVTGLAASTTSGSTIVSSTQLLKQAGVSGATCADDTTIYVCVSLVPGTGSTPKGSYSSSIDYSTAAPPVPTSVKVSPGDGALYVSWAAGPTSESAVEADHYEVTMTVTAGTDPTVRSSQSFTGTSGRFTGLVNGVTYGAKVSAVSAGGNASAFTTVTPASTGTPAPVSDFWDAYKARGGLDTGGCAGGAGGLLSLLGAAALARTFRRRS